MEKVIAVVVSYNRQQLLSECIKALRNQTKRPDAILVVNNGSTDHTEDWLKQQDDLFFITQKNVGSGGGFNAGISWAYQHGYSWVWCMDDDGYSREDALEQLLLNETHERSLMNCAVINKDDKKSFVWNTAGYKSLEEVKEIRIQNVAHPFNGTLIHRAIIEKAGLPVSSLFLWGDETEYYHRITRKYKFPVYTVASSIHYHPPSAFTYKQDWDFTSSWKMYFYIRNRFHIHKAKFANKIFALLNYICFIAAMAAIVMLYQKTDKIKKLNFILWPLKDAFSNNYEATPAYILNRLQKRQPSGNFILNIKTSLYNIWNMGFSGNTASNRNATM